MKKKNIFIIIILLIATCLIIFNRIDNNNNSSKESILGIKGIIETIEITENDFIIYVHSLIPNKDSIINNAIIYVKNNTIIKEKNSDKKYATDYLKENMLVEVYIKEMPKEIYPATIEASEIKVITVEHPDYLKYVGDMCYNILSTDQQENITNKNPNIREMRFEEGFKAYNISELGTIYTDIGNKDVYVVEFIQDKLMRMPNNIIIYVAKDNLKILGFGLVD